jgi:antibiotic biosynthesis monooxygenase (ABM) superfamily enzyme
MSLPEHLLIVAAAIDPGVEAEWNRWYDEVHLPEIVACPGFRSGQRYVAEDRSGAHRYVAIYELDGPDALQSAEFRARRGWGPFGDKVRFETLQYRRRAQVAK